VGGVVLLLILSLAGTVVFAASGAAAAVSKRLDLFGVMVLGAVTALGGGLIRDVLSGRVPPMALLDWRYPAAAIATAATIFWAHAQVFRLRRTMLVLDAAGLGLFTVVGTVAGLDAGVPWWGSCALGMITGVGGGVIRDVLTNEIPVVLDREIYAVASLAGAAVVAAADFAKMLTVLPMVGAAALVFALRLISLYRNWSAPKPKPG
jgi:uncharacterized membrane protein YeiH